jgi:hypothetical protein
VPDRPTTIRQPRPGIAILWLAVAGAELAGLCAAINFLPSTTRERIVVVVVILAAPLVMSAGLVYRARISSLTVGPDGIELRGYFLRWAASWPELARVEHVRRGPGHDYVLIHPAPGVGLPSIGVPTRNAVARELGRGAEPFLPLIANRFDGGPAALVAAFRKHAPPQVAVTGD